MDIKEIVICGAGIAGVSAAYFLSSIHKVEKVVIVDNNPPLSLTSNQSTECYRNWWPGRDAAMVELMNRSISIMEELAHNTNNVFHMNRRGYVYFTSNNETLMKMESAAQKCEEFGAGEVRYIRPNGKNRTNIHTHHKLMLDLTDGVDLITNKSILHSDYPYINREMIAALRIRKAGWLSAQQMGQFLLQKAKENGVKVIHGKINKIDRKSNNSWVISVENEMAIVASKLLMAAGPLIDEVGSYLDIEFPIQNELHLKVAFQDNLKIIPRHAPLLILADTQFLTWEYDELEIINIDDSLRWLLGKFPAGIHLRPEGGLQSQTILLLWDYKTNKMKPVYPIPIDPYFMDIILRGITHLIPEMSKYRHRYQKPQIDGGYYTRTVDNRPIIGDLEIEGLYIIGALSGFGIMAACGAGELVANYITGSDLPLYADSFSMKRFNNPGYVESLQDSDFSGQL